MSASRIRDRDRQSGYALLSLLASSAILLAGLALTIPRMAMQSQRVKEERLIERGQQYQRAIRLYYRQHNKYPREIEDLEETDGVRYLRRRYADPMGDTGEWRLIHMGTDGRFEDSLLYDLEDPSAGTGQGLFGGRDRGAAQGPTGQAGAMQPMPGTPGPPGFPEEPDPRLDPRRSPFFGAGRARMARESAAPDLTQARRYGQGFSFDPNQAPDYGADGGNEPGGRPDYSKMLPSTVPMDENEYQSQDPYAALENEGGASEGGGMLAGFPPGADGTGTIAGSQRTSPASTPGVAAGSSAAGLINRLLTSPRPGGMAGAAAVQPQAATAQVFERGIAGVASASEDAGVKVYKGKESFNEWEFVYDYRKDGERGARRGGIQGAPMQQRPGIRGSSQRLQPGIGSRGRPTR